MKSYQKLFAELKRRNVFKVSAVYGAVAFGLIQVADPLADAMRLPDTFVPFVVALLLLGFPVALVLAWAFELSPQGVRKTTAAGTGEIEAMVARPASERWPAGLLALAGVALLVAGAWWAGHRSGSAASEVDSAANASAVQLAYVAPDEDSRPSIAVLPFEDLSPAGDQEYFSDGMTEELLNVLAKIRELRVAARTSVFALKDVDLTATQIGDTLDVGYFVEGSVRKSGNRLRITAQLIDARDGSHLWSENFDRDLEDVFAIQTEIAEAIADQLRVPLGLDEGRALVSPTDDLEAYDLYLAGRARMRERGASVDEAVRLFEAAVAQDSSWAPAWAGLAEGKALQPFYRVADSTYWANTLAEAERAAEQALELDPGNASATVALANVHRDRWEWDAAEAAYRRALKLDPDNVEAYQQYAEFLGYVGRLDEANAAARRALALDRSPIRLNVAGYLALHDDRPEEAIGYLEDGIRADPEGRLQFLRYNLAIAHMVTDRAPVSRTLFLEFLGEFYPDLAERVARSWPSSSGLPSPEAVEILGAPDSPLVRNAITAQMWMLLDRPERAIRHIGSLRDRIPFGQTDWWWNPVFDPLRDDPRFQATQEAWGLAGYEVHRTGDRGASS
ncbi:MAG: tetratricopeptide repeat protein [Gemmatimonadales bacterium]|jgi:TolB-like protein